MSANGDRRTPMSTAINSRVTAIGRRRHIAAAIGFLFAMAFCAGALRAQQAFSAPEDALQALVSAAKAKDRTELSKDFRLGLRQAAVR